MRRLSAKCAIALFLWVAFAVAQTAPTTVTYSYTGYPLYIAIDSANVLTFANIVVPDALKITKVTAKVLVQYPYVGDLNLFLYSPDGTRAKLLERNCGSVANIDTTFDDAATTKFSDFCPADNRSPFKGNEPLSNFNSADSSLVTWRLMAENNGSDSRTGWLKSFTIQITGTPQIGPTFRPEMILNSASARGGAMCRAKQSPFSASGWVRSEGQWRLQGLGQPAWAACR